MEKVIIDIDLLIELSGLPDPANTAENLNSILDLLTENNLQPYIFDFQALHFDFNILKSKIKGIEIQIIEKAAYENALSVAGGYEEQFKVKLTELEKLSLLSYLGCGFTGIKYFLRKNEKPTENGGATEILNKFHTFNLELIKI